MKKVLIIANMLFVSATVFGMQNNELIRNNQSSNDLQTIQQQSQNWNANITCSLFRESENGNLNKVRDITSRYNVIDQQNEDGDTPLILAMMNDQLELVQFLVNVGANIELKNNYGCNVLSFAVIRGNQYFTELFLKKGIDINFKDSKEKSLLEISLDLCLEDMIGFLIERGAKIEYASVKVADAKISTLENELENPESEIDEDLLRNCIKSLLNIKELLIRGRVTSLLREGLLEGIRKRNGILLDQLLKNEDLINEQIAKSVGELYKNDPNSDKVMRVWNSKQLLRASLLGDFESVESLLNQGADVNYRNINGDTPLLLALKNNVEMNAVARLKTVKQLLCVDNIDIFAKNSDGSTALMDASEQGYSDIVKLLLKKILEKTQNNEKEFAKIINEKDREGNTAVMLAVQENHANVLKILAKNGADVSIANDSKASPLMYAAQDGDVESAQILIEYGADVNYQDDEGWTAYLSAISHGKYKLADLIKRHSSI